MKYRPNDLAAIIWTVKCFELGQDISDYVSDSRFYIGVDVWC